MVGTQHTDDDADDRPPDPERDDTVYAVRFTIGGRGCEAEYPFLNESSRDAFVALLEELDEVTKVSSYRNHDPDYVQAREEEPEKYDEIISGL